MEVLLQAKVFVIVCKLIQQLTRTKVIRSIACVIYLVEMAMFTKVLSESSTKYLTMLVCIYWVDIWSNCALRTAFYQPIAFEFEWVGEDALKTFARL
jgi:hypothetical protein